MLVCQTVQHAQPGAHRPHMRFPAPPANTRCRHAGTHTHTGGEGALALELARLVIPVMSWIPLPGFRSARRKRRSNVGQPTGRVHGEKGAGKRAHTSAPYISVAYVAAANAFACRPCDKCSFATLTLIVVRLRWYILGTPQPQRERFGAKHPGRD